MSGCACHSRLTATTFHKLLIDQVALTDREREKEILKSTQRQRFRDTDREDSKTVGGK